MQNRLEALPPDLCETIYHMALRHDYDQVVKELQRNVFYMLQECTDRTLSSLWSNRRLVSKKGYAYFRYCHLAGSNALMVLRNTEVIRLER